MTEALRNIQSELNAPKNLYNSFGKYSYRSCESILESLKPLLKKYGAEVVLTDKVVCLNDSFFLEATAIFTCGEDTVVTNGWAEIPREKKGMDSSQITGSASSYARKYALNGLFLIDDNKDADTDEHHRENESRAKKDTYGKDRKIGAQEIKQITDFANAVQVPMQNILNSYNLSSIQDMAVSQFVSAIKRLEANARQSEVNL